MAINKDLMDKFDGITLSRIKGNAEDADLHDAIKVAPQAWSALDKAKANSAMMNAQQAPSLLTRLKQRFMEWNKPLADIYAEQQIEVTRFAGFKVGKDTR